MNYNEQLIREYVKRNNQEYKGHDIYNECVKDMKEIDLKSITEEQVGTTIKRFLYEWGVMGRVLGRYEFKDWRNNLAKLLQRNSDKLENFKRKELADVDVSEFEKDITECYESFRRAVRPIAAAKVLHLVCPNFFPPWDNNIAKAVGKEVNRRKEARPKVEEFSGGDYYRFMKEVQIFIIKYKDVLSDSASQYGKSKLKIVDDCFWYATQRPLSLFF